MLAAALIALPGIAWACDEGRVEIRGNFGDARFRVEIADDAEERAVGLMNRESLSIAAGMLFVYPDEDIRGFWMENTLIPLDMIFADATGTIVKVHANAVPLDRTSILSDAPAQFVLEINGGLAARIGIEAGDEMRHPLIDQDIAAWSCSPDTFVEPG
ncbi:DUF192 domain-containing protein [Rhodobacterales bacterium HKCCE2091]|nr:DUF192 domain-containing protein [Rhodobacterales bacterium HKCCE2091]